MHSYVYDGPLGQHIHNFIVLKRITGNKYESAAGTLKRIDQYLKEFYPTAKTLTKEMVIGWGKKSAHETDKNHCSRASVLRQFAKYLDSIGVSAWILPHNYYPQGHQYIPHIYTEAELKKFFIETEKCHISREVPFRHLIMPEFFRLLLACGLRCSEARLLKVKDVDLEAGVLTIMESKNRNCRLVPMPAFMVSRLKIYRQKVHPYPELENWFFPGFGNKPMTVGNIYKNFRKFLWKAGISHTGDGPRVHDFRHTYCCYRLRQWSIEGKDLLVLIPMLRTYLGHQTFNETAYYLRWTSEVFPEIRLQLQEAYGDIIPQIKELKNEAD